MCITLKTLLELKLKQILHMNYQELEKSIKLNKENMFEQLNNIMDYCYNQSKEAGWHDNPREDGTMIALIHSEVSEAMEGLRKDLMDDHLPHRPMAEVELADAIIRICDFAGYKGYDLSGAVKEKLEYNLHRADHKKENRAKNGGKKF